MQDTKRGCMAPVFRWVGALTQEFCELKSDVRFDNRIKGRSYQKGNFERRRYRGWGVK